LVEISRALALHIRVGVINGQGRDLYVQACVFSKQSRLDEAESTARRAIELHSQVGEHYYHGLALAKLSSILWQRFKRDRTLADRTEALKTIDKAIKLFHWDESVDVAQCRCRRKEMVEDAPHMSCESIDHNDHVGRT